MFYEFTFQLITTLVYLWYILAWGLHAVYSQWKTPPYYLVVSLLLPTVPGITLVVTLSVLIHIFWFRILRWFTVALTQVWQNPVRWALLCLAAVTHRLLTTVKLPEGGCACWSCFVRGGWCNWKAQAVMFTVWICHPKLCESIWVTRGAVSPPSPLFNKVMRTDSQSLHSLHLSFHGRSIWETPGCQEATERPQLTYCWTMSF